MPKAKQVEMQGEGMQPDEVGTLAEAYLTALDTVKESKERAQTSQDNLVAKMREKRRREIHVKGVTITLRHVDAQDIVKVKKSKQP